MPKKIPATILTGFLGSGKTTILNSIINNKLFKNTLVIVNEFGKISIDHHLIKKKSNDKINIVVATSGDTGAAAVSAFKQKENINLWYGSFWSFMLKFFKKEK